MQAVNSIPEIHLSSEAVCVNGEPQIILCSSLFYFRVPKALWKDRLEKVKSFGYNCIDVYFPWNYHELRQGEWDFTGEKDVESFLQAAAEAGLWIVARPGPYICSEWDGGALPAYLLAEDNIRLRDNDPLYLQHVSRWFGKILPLIGKYQLSKGGSVICVQLENELDFYDCKDPNGYISALRDMALQHGIEVPLIACAGQGGLKEASGLTAQVVPTCNFYPNDRDPSFEEKVLHYYDELHRRGFPLLVTETNRSHFLLRRLLSAGTKLLGPYLQVSGTDFGFTNATNNWGKPLAFMTSDYDFGGMISPEGHIREEAYEGRLLGRILQAYGSSLAKAQPAEERGAFGANDELPSSIVSRVLNLNKGGSLLFVTNIGEQCEELEALPGIDGAPRCAKLVVKANRSLILPLELPLDQWGMEGTLAYSTAELFDIRRSGTKTSLYFHSDHTGEISLRFAGEYPVETNGMVVHGTADSTTLMFDPRTVSLMRIQLPDGHILELVTMDRSRALLLESYDEDGQPLFGERVAYANEPETISIPWELASIDSSSTMAEHDFQLGEKADYLEKHQIYRGFAWYEASLNLPDGKMAKGLLLEQAGDVVSLYSGGRYLGTVTPAGGSFYLPLSRVGQLEERITARAEIWGHTNFDDANLPGLRLHAMKGLTGIQAITAVKDITQNWRVSRAKSAQTEHDIPADDSDDRLWPIVGWGGWLSPDHPSFEFYRRTVEASADADAWTLHFPDIRAIARVYVNGQLAGQVNPHSPYLSITQFVSAGEPIVLTALIERAYGLSAGKVLLYEGSSAADWRLSSCQEEHLLRHAEAGYSAAEAVKLPMELQPGQMAWLYGVLMDSNGDQGWRVLCRGTNMKLTVMLGEHLVGRLWLPGGTSRPVLTGGKADSFYLPGPWFNADGTGKLTLLLEAVVEGEASKLEALSFVPV